MHPLMLISAFCVGSLSAYLAHKRGRNPYIWFFVGFLFGIFGIFTIFFATQKHQPPASLKTPIISIHGPKDKFWYYLDPTHQQQGPVSHATLTTIWKEGKINLATLIWHEDLTDWQPLKEMIKTD